MKVLALLVVMAAAPVERPGHIEVVNRTEVDEEVEVGGGVGHPYFKFTVPSGGRVVIRGFKVKSLLPVCRDLDGDGDFTMEGVIPDGRGKYVLR